MDAPECRLPEAKRGPAVTIRVDGRAVRAYVGESVAAALYGNGQRVLSRSIKYHRPRGLYCGVGKCASCFMRVDGKPNVRTCVTPVREGLVAESQNAIPTAKLDLLSVIDKVYRKDFDYHEKFIRPRLLKPVYHGVIRRMAGFGEIPDAPKGPQAPGTLRHLTVDVAVVGAGDAGRAAAAAAAKAGASVALFDEAPAAADLPGVNVHAAHQAVALYPEEGLVVMSEKGLLQVHAKAHVIATGTYDVLPVFEGNDLPGILSPRAAAALLNSGIAPGRRIVLAGATERAAALAARLASQGLTPIAVVADGERAASPFPTGVTLLAGSHLVAAHGARVIEAVTVRDGEGNEEVLGCDALILCHPPIPRPELFQQAGCALDDDPATGAFLPRVSDRLETSVPRVFACGGALGPRTPAEAAEEGARAGEAAARAARGKEVVAP